MDTYVDTSVLYPDTKVCDSFCVSGVIWYNLVVGSGLDDWWVLKNVVHNISKYHFCKKAAGVFGKVILWASFDSVAFKHVPQYILLRIQSQYKYIHTLAPETNPVKKVALIDCGHEDQLFIDKWVVDGVEGPAVNDETHSATVKIST